MRVARFEAPTLELAWHVWTNWFGWASERGLNTLGADLQTRLVLDANAHGMPSDGYSLVHAACSSFVAVCRE
eukprot:1453244-Amphidinium_carterae.1